MNQGKLEMVKQEMTRANIDILGIGDQKQTRMGEFNSDEHFIYYCGQEFLRRNGVALRVNKRFWNAVHPIAIECNLKDDRMICVRFQGKPFKHSNLSLWRKWQPTPIFLPGESHGKNGVALMVNKRVQNAVLGCNPKKNKIIMVLFQGKPFNTTVIQVYDPITNAEQAQD